MFASRFSVHAFTLRGIPVSIDLFFLLGPLIVYDYVGGGVAGIFAAIALFIFVLIHEMGHALTAERFGATNVSVTLNFLVGWASYTPPGTLTRRQRNLISLAGPLSQMTAALALFAVNWVALGLADAPPTIYYEIASAIGWSGILIGFLNLMPLFPLDGGHITEELVESRFGREGRSAFLWWTVGASAFMFVAFLGRRSFASGLDEQWRELWLAGVQSNPLGALLRFAAAAPFVGTTSLLLAFFCGLSAAMALRSEGSFVVPERKSPPREYFAKGDRQRRKAQRQQRRRGENVVPMTPSTAKHLDRQSQADMDRLLDKIADSGIGSLTPDERQRLDELSRRLREQ